MNPKDWPGETRIDAIGQNVGGGEMKAFWAVVMFGLLVIAYHYISEDRRRLVAAKSGEAVLICHFADGERQVEPHKIQDTIDGKWLLDGKWFSSCKYEDLKK